MVERKKQMLKSKQKVDYKISISKLSINYPIVLVGENADGGCYCLHSLLFSPQYCLGGYLVFLNSLENFIDIFHFPSLYWRPRGF